MGLKTSEIKITIDPKMNYNPTYNKFLGNNFIIETFPKFH